MPTSIVIPSIKWGKRKERSQMYLIETVDSRLIESELPVSDKCAEWDEHRVAFLPDTDNQAQRNGTYYQFVFERNSIPLAFKAASTYKEENMEKLRDSLFEEAFEQRQMEGIDQIENANRWTKISMIVGWVCATAIIIAAIRWFAG